MHTGRRREFGGEATRETVGVWIGHQSSLPFWGRAERGTGPRRQAIPSADQLPSTDGADLIHKLALIPPLHTLTSSLLTAVPTASRRACYCQCVAPELSICHACPSRLRVLIALRSRSTLSPSFKKQGSTATMYASSKLALRAASSSSRQLVASRATLARCLHSSPSARACRSSPCRPCPRREFPLE